MDSLPDFTASQVLAIDASLLDDATVTEVAGLAWETAQRTNGEARCALAYGGAFKQIGRLIGAAKEVAGARDAMWTLMGYLVDGDMVAHKDLATRAVADGIIAPLLLQLDRDAGAAVIAAFCLLALTHGKADLERTLLEAGVLDKLKARGLVDRSTRRGADADRQQMMRLLRAATVTPHFCCSCFAPTTALASPMRCNHCTAHYCSDACKQDHENECLPG
jgi:hypothetical protein